LQDYREFISKILIPEDVLQKRIQELGEEISRDYAGKDLLLVCVLRGGIMFLVDLMRQIHIPHKIEFMAVSSYGLGQRSTTGQARITLDLDININDYHVLMVEDIIDSGYTMNSLLKLLSIRQPKSLEVCALLDKSSRREVEVPIRYRGFEIPDEFVFGYGLDMDEYYRNLPFVAVVDLDRYNTLSKNNTKS